MDQNGDGTSNIRAMAPADGNKTATAPELPYDVLVEILLHLPAKSVLRFRAVCKPWRRLLSDPIFVHDHHRRAPVTVLLNNPCIDDGGAISALPFPYTDQSKASPLYCGIASHQTYVQGCCDGLLLISCSCLRPPELDANHEMYRYFVCNPATREFSRLPAGLGHAKIVGFYRHAPTAEYRVLCYKHMPPSNHCEYKYEYFVAAPGQHTARRLGPSNLWRDTDWALTGVPVTHRGCLHWMLRRRPSMGNVVFDTISEKFRLMSGPVDGDTRMDDMFGNLVGVDGTLGASVFAQREKTLKLWVLESYEEEAWVLRYTIEASTLAS